MNALRWLREGSSISLMSHLTGIGATRDSIGAFVDELESLGIGNILTLRGDPPKNAPDFNAAKNEFSFARDLVDFLKKTGLFSLGVAVYLEGHRESPSLAKDLKYTKQKIDAGADFAITQMFFENDHYYRFLEHAAKAGISILIIPRIMPILDCKRIKEFANVCNATIPQAILDRIEPVMDIPEKVRKLGIDFAIGQVRDLMKHGVKFIHFFTRNRADSVIEILNATGLGRRLTPIAA